MHFAFPQFTDAQAHAVSNFAGTVLEKVAGMAPVEKSTVSVAQQAHFTALDGTTRVKKANSNSWLTADYNVPLEKGDVVQTGSEGMAKIVFNDGTNYTVKQDSLIVIEENSANDQQQTNVAVAVSTGTVDLTTATYVQGSKSQVIVAGATASLAPESAAMVRNDPKGDQHEILIKKGSRTSLATAKSSGCRIGKKSAFKSDSQQMEQVEGNRAADADFAGEHDADFRLRRRTKRRRIFVDAHGERGGISAADFEESVLLVIGGGPQSRRCGRNGVRVWAKALITGRFSLTTRMEKSRSRARRTALR